MRSSLFGAALAAAVAALCAAPMAHASTLTPIYGFCKQTDCLDGFGPEFPVTFDNAGNLYGVTTNNGTKGTSILYELKNNAGTWTQKTLFQFCAAGTTCHKGSVPTGRVAVDPAGNVFGVTLHGNDLSSNDGVLYEVTAKGDYAEQDKFCDPNCEANGGRPTFGLTWLNADAGAPFPNTGGAGLVGTASGGGAGGTGTLYATFVNGHGAVQISPFNGLIPEDMIEAAATGPTGIFFTTFSVQHGGLFEFNGAGATKVWTFCAAESKCNEGSDLGMFTVDGNGNFFGTTTRNAKKNNGAIWELTAPHYKKVKVVHAFCTAKNCADGGGGGTYFGFPMARDATGNVYGVTTNGGKQNAGTIFRIGADGKYARLYDFCALASCADGSGPLGGLTIDAAGNLYGTTFGGGPLGHGEVFEFTP